MRSMLVVFYSALHFTLCFIVKLSEQGIISNDPNDLKFIYYPSPNNPKVIQFGNLESLKTSGLTSNAPTILLIDGFYSDGNSRMNQNLTSAFLSLHERKNIIVVDWGDLSGRRLRFLSTFDTLIAYLGVVGNVSIIGKRISEFLKFLKFYKEIQFHDVHIVGHSLGAHIAGTTGKYVISQYHDQIGRITGLDPAGPGYSRFSLGAWNDEKLLKGDASYVDIYFTNQGVLGDITDNVGDINVYINGGKSQPGCEKFDMGLAEERLKGYCSHTYSWKIFYFSILTRGFPACPCLGKKCKCSTCGNERCSSPIIAGLPVSFRSKGDYYVNCTDPLLEAVQFSR